MKNYDVELFLYTTDRTHPLRTRIRLEMEDTSKVDFYAGNYILLNQWITTIDGSIVRTHNIPRFTIGTILEVKCAIH